MLLNVAIIIVLMGLAIGLILLEIFLLPGITLAGVGGLLFAAGGLIFAYSIGATVGHLTLIISLLLFVVIFVWLLRSQSFNRVALHTDVDSRLESSRDLGIKPGDEGVTLSRLAPIGKANIQGKIVEAKAQDELIDESQAIVVVRVDSYNVVVRRKEKE